MAEPRDVELKTWPQYFLPLLLGDKTFEMRRNDRDFRVGDVLVLKEWHPETGYTGRVLRKRVIYVMEDVARFGLSDGFVCLGLESSHAQRLQALEAALKSLTDDMDRAGGDGYGMPECPWCGAQEMRDGDDKWHEADCELAKARAALLTSPPAPSSTTPRPSEAQLNEWLSAMETGATADQRRAAWNDLRDFYFPSSTPTQEKK